MLGDEPVELREVRSELMNCKQLVVISPVGALNLMFGTLRIRERLSGFSNAFSK